MTWRDLMIATHGKNKYGKSISKLGHPDNALYVEIDGKQHFIRAVDFQSDRIVFKTKR